MQVRKPPSALKAASKSDYTIFLAGSIEMGKAEDWQSKVEQSVKKDIELFTSSVVLLNPRRDDWDSSWKQTIDDDNFRGQVEWEFKGLSQADLIFLYFDPETKAPISLMELGLFADKSDMIVVCPDGFYRKGNVEFICKEFGIPLLNTLQEGIDLMLNEYIS